MYVYNGSVSAFEPRLARTACFAILLPAATSFLFAQLPAAPAGGGAARPIVLPQTGRTSPAGSVSIQQSTSPAGVDTVNTSLQVGGNLQGSLPGAKPPAGPISLTLGDAIKMGLDTNLGAIAAGNASAAASAQRLEAYSALLPYISVGASDTVAQTNLAAFGFVFNVPAGFNFSIPSVVGPYNYSQAQVALSESVYDPVARRNCKAARESSGPPSSRSRMPANWSSWRLRAPTCKPRQPPARIASQRAQVDNAQAVYDQARIRKEAGTNARIDVMRTLVELQTQKQRLNSLASDLRKQKLALARIIGLPLDRDLTLTEPLTPETIPIPEPAGAVAQALKHRSDLAAAKAQVSAAERAVMPRAPSVCPPLRFNGDYGVLGANPVETHGVFTATGSVTVPFGPATA